MIYWTMTYYQHPETGHVVVYEGASRALTLAGYEVIGHHMYCEPLISYDTPLRGTRYVFTLTGCEGVGHYDVDHATGEVTLTLHPEPAVSVDHEVTDAERDADARREQAADERHAERMRGR